MNTTLKIFKNELGICGRLISPSKSTYRDSYRNNEVYFNANIFTIKGKVWYGDIDVTLDRTSLVSIANKLSEPLYILKELDGRFENEDLNETDMIKLAVCIIKPA